MGGLTRVLARLLGYAARLLPPERRQWAEAVGAEAGQVAAGWPRLRWLAGGLWLAVTEAKIVRKVMYWLGAGAVAAAGGWVVWLSWRTSPTADPQAVTDRVRVLVAAAALVVLPWVGRRRGWFGPVGGTITARLVRVAGCAAFCGLGVAVVRMDSHLGLGPHQPGPFSLLREIIAVGVLAATLAALAVVKARWPDADPSALWSIAAIAGLLVLFAVPVQALAVVYVAGILAATSRRSPVSTVSLAGGTVAGLATGLATVLAIYEVARTSDRYARLLFLAVVTVLFLLAALAGLAAGWALPGTGDPHELRVARGRQGLLAGSVTGAVCGLLLTNFFIMGVGMMLIGPLVGALGGAAGGLIVGDNPRRSKLARSWAAGLFVRS